MYVTNRDLSALVLIGCDGFIGLSCILLQPKRLTLSHTHNITHQVAVVSHCAAVEPGIEPGSRQPCSVCT